MESSSVTIHGAGVAASCCLRLLGQAGLSVSLAEAARPRVPAIMLSATTQKLLQDVFVAPGLFAGMPKVNKRIVAWRENDKPLELPHSAVVVSEEALLERISRSAAPHQNPEHAINPGWTIFAARPLPPSVQEHSFGSRFATASSVTLKTGSPADACWIESLQDGWLFLLPGLEGAWLLSVGRPVESLLGESRVIANQIADSRNLAGQFPSHPRIADPLCAAGWFACGTAALGFDPLCGDGTGHAVREAILASAAIRSVYQGADVDAIIAHYRTRLLAGFNRHLEVCQQFYQSGRSGPWWDEQVNSAKRGLEWCKSGLAASTKFRYRLSGFSLEAIE